VQNAGKVHGNDVRILAALLLSIRALVAKI